MELLYFLSLIATIAAASICPQWTSQSLSNPNKCYYFGIENLAYMNAEEQCVNRGGHLVSIHSIEEDFYLSQKASIIFNGTTIDFWIGANKMSGDWAWLDGSDFDFINWDIAEPNDTVGNNNICAVASISNGKWSSQDCFKVKSYICEIFVVNETVTTTTDPTTVAKSSTRKATSRPSHQCSTRLEQSCGDALEKRAEQVCGADKAAKTPFCSDVDLEKMCCKNPCSDCQIKDCRCPHSGLEVVNF